MNPVSGYAQGACLLVPADRRSPVVVLVGLLMGAGLLGKIGLGKTWFPPVTVCNNRWLLFPLRDSGNGGFDYF